jgi:SAM-dependent methyltransferase
MSDKSRKANRWKEAQKREFEFYWSAKKREKFSKDYIYRSSAQSYKFERWDFKEFDEKAILEVGCNVFGPLHFIRGKETFKVGIDPLLGTLYEEVAAKDIFYIRSVGEKLPFVEGQFDVVFCDNVLDHVINPNEVLEEIHRVLKSQGLFLLCVNAYPKIIAALKTVIQYIDREHPYHFIPQEIKLLVESQGFTIVRSKVFVGFDTLTPKYKLLKRWLREGKWKAFSGFFFFRTLYVTAKKSC